ncbi:type II secretion system F family protein [Patescibacteria group bacterium]|nr:type II secretion system F family protein [Patescibacteria group bacterium]MBU1682790.1 type II secretion system F family protein [Patescibacteria group bacterium]
MFIFTITATDAFGNKKKVEIKAQTPEEALQILKGEGFRATLDDITDARKDTWWTKLQEIDFISRLSQVAKKDVLRLIKMLGNSLSRGRTLKATLEFIGENEDSKGLKNVIMKLIERMEKPFTSQVEIFNIFPQYFDEEFLGIIEAGETSSNLGEYLSDYVKEKKKQMELTAKFHSVLIKRGVTLIMILVVALIVVIFVIPQFKALFGEKMAIPWAMNFLLTLSKFFVRFGIIIGIIFGLSIATFYYFTVNHEKTRWWWHDFLLHMPILGKTLRTYYTAQFAYLLSTLLTKNVDIIRSMEIIIRQNNNVCMQNTYTNIIKCMQGGDDLFTAIIKENDAGRDYLIPSIVQAAKVGGATASLGDTLMDVRNDLDELFVIRLERAIKGFSAVFYAIIVMFAVFLAYAIGSAIIAFYENAQSLI